MRLVGTGSLAILVLWTSGSAPASAGQIDEEAFSELEKWFIATYLEDREGKGEHGRDHHRGKGKGRGRGKHSKRGGKTVELLTRGGTLPPGLRARALPDALESKLPPLPEHLERILVGERVALVEKATRVVQDVFEHPQARGNGPPAKLAVCHVPPGNPSKRKTLSLPEPATRAHLGHGDYIGRCR